MNSKTKKRLVVMGDPHAHPDYDNSRFRLAGQFVRDCNADTFVCTGDWFDFPSLSKHSSADEVEGRRVTDDVEAGHDALHEFEGSLGRKVRPRRVMTAGNHDVRIGRTLREKPQLIGIAANILKPFDEAGWETHGYQKTVVVDGFLFSHHLASGPMGRPIGGVSGEVLARNLLLKGGVQAIVGHDHRFGHASFTGFDREKRHAFSAGCWVHPGYREDWCEQTERLWDRGLLLIEMDDRDRVEYYAWWTMDAVVGDLS